MARSSPTPPSPGVDESALLGALLTDEVPSRREQIRATLLRSIDQQREEALRGLKFRNHLDRLLLLAERLLLVATALTFIYWLADGYGRDWLYSMGLVRPAALVVPTATPTLNTALTSRYGAALLFTQPAPSVGADGTNVVDQALAPQLIPGSTSAHDPKPRRLHIPSIGADMAVYEVYLIDGEWQVAEYAAGYHHGSALPGTIGNSVISGHAGLRGAVFKDLAQLKPGDSVLVETHGWSYTYRVRSLTNVWPYQVEVMDPTPSPVLTLITCTNWDTQRLIVVADLVDARPLG
jgi:sortase A